MSGRPLPPYRPTRFNIARAEDNTIIVGPSNSIWLVACDYKPRDTTESQAAMWWRFSNRSDPATDGHIFRMNAQPATSVDEAADDPPAFVSTLAEAISATNSLACEDICLFWHGIHITTSSENTPYRLHNADEEYYGQPHRRAPVPLGRHPSREERQAAHDETERRKAPSRGTLHVDYVDDQEEVDPSQYEDPAQAEAFNRTIRSNRELMARERQQRRVWDEMFMFNWPSHDSVHRRPADPPARHRGHGHPQVDPGDVRNSRSDDWPTRYDNPNYKAVVKAFHDHPHVRRIHLYGCDLADPEFLHPILNLTEDIAAGNSGDTRVTNKEVWVYSDLTETEWFGEQLFISHTRRHATPEKGVRQLADGSYEVVRLHTNHGPLPGWQVRGRIDGERAIVEKLVIQRATRSRPAVYTVDKVDLDGCWTPRTTTVHDRTVITSHYTPVTTINATDPTDPPPPPPEPEGQTAEERPRRRRHRH